MIIICCYESVHESQINWETITALGTVALALFTIILAIAAIGQLLDIKKFIKQNENLNLVQSAENIITNQIAFHYKILERIEANQKDAFRIMYESLNGFYKFRKKSSPKFSKIKEQINAAFEKMYNDYGNLSGHYFRNLYRIFKEIDKSKIDGFDKQHYAKLVRAQLSEYEVLLLFYNCIWVGDGDKFKKLVEKYELLEGINYSKLIEREHYKLYEETAFGVDLT